MLEPTILAVQVTPLRTIHPVPGSRKVTLPATPIHEPATLFTNVTARFPIRRSRTLRRRMSVPLGPEPAPWAAWHRPRSIPPRLADPGRVLQHIHETNPAHMHPIVTTSRTNRGPRFREVSTLLVASLLTGHHPSALPSSETNVLVAEVTQQEDSMSSINRSAEQVSLMWTQMLDRCG